VEGDERLVANFAIERPMTGADQGRGQSDSRRTVGCWTKGLFSTGIIARAHR
jgi:hypothetical protein